LLGLCDDVEIVDAKEFLGDRDERDEREGDKLKSNIDGVSALIEELG